jgi:hypothetical protein
MKTNKIFAAIVFGFVACATSVNAQENVNLNDFAYQMAKLEKNHYTDHVVYSYADDPHEYTAGARAKHGAYIGLTGGAQYFDGHVSPMGGVVVGWEGKHIGFEYDGTFAVGHYTEEADRNNPFVEFDSRLMMKFKVLANNSQSWQLWIDPYFSYKLSFDYHENNSSTTTVRETDTEIITTIDKLANNYEFKASSMGVGLRLELVHRPYMSPWAFRGYIGSGTQQLFYSDGNRFHPEFFGGFAVTYNFDASAIWDGSFLQKTGLSKKQAKKLSKERARVELNDYNYMTKKLSEERARMGL